ncbi:MAG: GIY-YIG nuclease family protein, partial [Deltaproteobacteria bacterium]|nr:GIY-YIG nuclease family protein [Deltaproteobacteria bacterium]
MFDKKKLQNLSHRPGVYLMKDQSGRIIYIGKAKDLRARVRSYFAEEEQLTPKNRLLVRNILAIDWIVTESEKEAFILECTLIKQHHPKYNISLRDDKSYPYLRLSV